VEKAISVAAFFRFPPIGKKKGKFSSKKRDLKIWGKTPKGCFPPNSKKPFGKTGRPKWNGKSGPPTGPLAIGQGQSEALYLG